MPVVVADDAEKPGEYVVVDGFHRTTVAKTDKEVAASLGGYVPVVKLNKSIEDRITSTVRHNMARGSHQVELTAKLVTALKKHNWSNERIGLELGMDPDEVLRLKQITGLAEAFADKEFSRAWK
jgi:ParB-like chromosome segregation protein Spo0J